MIRATSISSAIAAAEDAIEQARDRLAELKRQRQAIAGATVPKAEAVRRAKAWVKASATELQLSVRDFALRTPGFDASIIPSPSALGTWADHRVTIINALRVGIPALFCALAPAQIEALLVAEVERFYATDQLMGLTDAERDRRTRELDAEILLAEIEEELGIRAMTAAGFPLDRRGDALPEVVLAYQHELEAAAGKAAA